MVAGGLASTGSPCRQRMLRHIVVADTLTRVITQRFNRPSSRFGPLRLRWTVAVVALVGVIAGCASDGGGDGVETASDVEAATSERASGSSSTDGATSLEDGHADGSELVATAGGGQIDWNSLQGQDVVLWFWAPW